VVEVVMVVVVPISWHSVMMVVVVVVVVCDCGMELVIPWNSKSRHALRRPMHRGGLPERRSGCNT
jgi:hypothetical protein